MVTATKKKTTTKKAPTVSQTTENNESGLKTLKETIFMPSGNVGMDIVLSNGRGIPLGANILLFGMPGTGKTTLLCDILKRNLDKYKAQGLPFRCHYVDSESSRDLLKSTGLWEYVYDPEEYAPQQVIYHEHINSLKQLDEMYGRIQNPNDNWGKEIVFIVIDSINKLSADGQLTNEVDKADFGEDAKVRKKLEKKWFSIIQQLDITQFWVSQMAVVQNAMQFAEKNKPAVTNFDLHNMDIILKLTADKDTKNVDIKKIEYDTIQGKQEDITKYLVEVDPGKKTWTKNRYGQNIPLKIMLWRGHGIINTYVLRRMLEELGFTKKINAEDFSLSQELADYLGAEALEAAGIKDIAKVKRKPYLNRLCSQNNGKLIQFFKERDLYRMKKDETVVPEDEDDGLF